MIPQIYHQDMFGEIEAIYPFKHVIYTLYASPDSAEEVLDFISKHKEIEALTIPIDDSRLTPEVYRTGTISLENGSMFIPYKPMGT